jgi:hypothetical protein
MILKWDAPDGATHYLDGLDHVALLGVWHRRDDRDYGGVEIPDYQARNEAAGRVWSVPLDHIANSDPGVLAFVLTDGRAGHLIEEIDCLWMGTLNDRGDTIDTLVRRRP